MAVEQPTPETPTKATKAVAGAIVTVVLSFLTSIRAGLPDGISAGEWLDATIAALVSAGVIFGTVYTVTNRPK